MNRVTGINASSAGTTVSDSKRLNKAPNAVKIPNAFTGASGDAANERKPATAESDVMLRFKDGKFETRKTLSRGEWGVTQDDAGRIYRNTNESVLHADLVPTQYFTRNPNLLRTRGSYERLSDEENLANVVWPVRKNPGAMGQSRRRRRKPG